MVIKNVIVDYTIILKSLQSISLLYFPSNITENKALLLSLPTFNNPTNLYYFQVAESSIKIEITEDVTT